MNKDDFPCGGVDDDIRQLSLPSPSNEAFNAQRAMYGKGHSFTWDGQTYTTDHPEEVAAAAASERR